ncbi:hypothetical protein EAN99_02415 [Klebsiella pneumoniae]|nr:hypothetical protein EAN99_02415 [Klebsiella pneumoniae]
MLACFPAGRGDTANQGRFVLKMPRSGINHYRVPAVPLSAAYSLFTTTHSERFSETGHSAVTAGIICRSGDLSYSQCPSISMRPCKLTFPLYYVDRERPASLLA